MTLIAVDLEQLKHQLKRPPIDVTHNILHMNAVWHFNHVDEKSLKAALAAVD